MDEPKFSIDGKNPLTELSELRFELDPAKQNFSLKCLLRFGKMQYERNKREYEVGVSRAYLRLSLEGCETTLGSAFGESVLETVVEEDAVEAQATIGVKASFDTDSIVGASAGASASGTRKRSVRQNTVHLPVTARPNDCWEVQSKSVSGQLANMIEGTAIPGTHLCDLRRKRGGNRMTIVGEVQVSKSAIKVSAKGGNFLNKTMSEWQNKDAIVSQILKRAIQREATSTIPGKSDSVVAICRCEVLEE